MDLDDEERRAVEFCAGAMLRWTRGHVEWGLHAPRYTRVAEEYRRDRAGSGRPAWMDELIGVRRHAARRVAAEMIIDDR